ncbi:MAG: DUF4249 domain-containing protein [Prolixibacteraceae bacterium]|nr:DUF4249 domain-containing protein [Prolixibacteraceae bacterium]
MKQLSFIFFGVSLFLILLASCEEYYTPAIDDMPKLMVVDSHITNDPQQNFVRISKTRSFYSTSAIDWVGGAVVELVAENFQIIKGREDAPGYYVFPSTPVSGRRYKLRITYLKDIFESDYLMMPPIPTIDSLYTRHEVEKVYKTNGYNVPELFDQPGRQIYIDAPVTPQLQYYQFNYRAIIQWVFNPYWMNDSANVLIHKKSASSKDIASIYGPIVPLGDDTSKHYLYGWISETNKNLFNLAGPKEFSVTKRIEKHPIVALAYNSYEYLDSTVQEPYNWIVILDQYGIPKESFDFHEKLNRQFSADGTLFDPVIGQVYGNILCKTDPEKIVLGFFDLNSYKQYRYYLNLGAGSDETVILRQLDEFFDIPDRGYRKDEPPIFWETNYKR